MNLKQLSGNKSRMVKDSKNTALFDEVDSVLSSFGDIHVSRFYSDDNMLTLAADYEVWRNNASQIKSEMRGFGYDLYNTGGNGDSIMLDFKKSRVSDSRRVRDAKRGKDVFTIEIFNDTQEADITPMSLCVTYYDIDEAIADMEEEMQSYQGESDTIYGWVFAGEYETESGDIFGEPEVVYSASNKD